MLTINMNINLGLFQFFNFCSSIVLSSWDISESFCSNSILCDSCNSVFSVSNFSISADWVLLISSSWDILSSFCALFFTKEFTRWRN